MMLKQQRLLLLILSGSVFSFSAYAVASNELDDTEMLLFDDIPSVFSASKYEQKVTEAPARINIVTAREIEHYGYQSLADILRNEAHGEWWGGAGQHRYPGLCLIRTGSMGCKHPLVFITCLTRHIAIQVRRSTCRTRLNRMVVASG